MPYTVSLHLPDGVEPVQISFAEVPPANYRFNMPDGRGVDYHIYHVGGEQYSSYIAGIIYPEGRVYSGARYVSGVDPISEDAPVQMVRLTRGLAEYAQSERRLVNRQQILDELTRAQQERAQQKRAAAYTDSLREYYRAVSVDPRNPAEEVELDTQERTAAAIIDREAVRYAAQLRERAAAQEAIQYAFGGADHYVFTDFLGDSIGTAYTGDGILANSGRSASPWEYTRGFSYQDLDVLFKEPENKIGMFIPAAEKIEEPKFSQEELDDCPFL